MYEKGKFFIELVDGLNKRNGLIEKDYIYLENKRIPRIYEEGKVLVDLGRWKR